VYVKRRFYESPEYIVGVIPPFSGQVNRGVFPGISRKRSRQAIGIKCGNQGTALGTKSSQDRPHSVVHTTVEVEANSDVVSNIHIQVRTQRKSRKVVNTVFHHAVFLQ